MISRRQAIQRSGLLALGTLSSLPTVDALTPEPSINGIAATSASPTPYSRELDLWMQDKLTTMACTVLSGKAQSKDWMQASHAVRIYANHLRDTGIDDASEYIAAAIRGRKVDVSQHAVVAQTLDKIPNADAYIDRGKVATKLVFSEETTRTAAESIRKVGYSGQFHGIANVLMTAAVTLRAAEIRRSGFDTATFLQGIKPASYGNASACSVPAVYDASHKPHLVRAGIPITACKYLRGLVKSLGLSQQTVSQICSALDAGTVVAGVAAGAAQIVCDGGIVVSIIATDGVAAVIASPLETLVCNTLSFAAGTTAGTVLQCLSTALSC